MRTLRAGAQAGYQEEHQQHGPLVLTLRISGARRQMVLSNSVTYHRENAVALDLAVGVSLCLTPNFS